MSVERPNNPQLTPLELAWQTNEKRYHEPARRDSRDERIVINNADYEQLERAERERRIAASAQEAVERLQDKAQKDRDFSSELSAVIDALEAAVVAYQQ
jgi:hypothetical protein